MHDKLRDLMELNHIAAMTAQTATNAELETAVLELAAGQSDLEDALLELAAMIGGDD